MVWARYKICAHTSLLQTEDSYRTGRLAQGCRCWLRSGPEQPFPEKSRLGLAWFAVGLANFRRKSPYGPRTETPGLSQKQNLRVQKGVRWSATAAASRSRWRRWRCRGNCFGKSCGGSTGCSHDPHRRRSKKARVGRICERGAPECRIIDRIWAEKVFFLSRFRRSGLGADRDYRKTPVSTIIGAGIRKYLGKIGQ